MKFAVNMTAPHVVNSLREDNLRGEPRWERQVVEALLVHGHEVYNMTGHGQWVNNQPSNYHTKVPAGEESKMVGLAHDFQPNSVPPRYKAQIFNMFSTHYFRDIPHKVQEYQNVYGDRLIYAQGYHDSSIIQDIRKHVPEQNYEWLPCPSAPDVCNEDHFNKKRLVWCSRGIHLHTFPEKENPDLPKFLAWIAEKLRDDPSMELWILPGIGPRDMEWQGWPGTVEDRIMQSSIMQAHLGPYRSQIKVQEACDWSTVLEIMKEAKLSISPAPDRWGGPPVEAGMHGIPYPVIQGPNLYKSCPGVLQDHDIDGRMKTYEQLYKNHGFYRSHGDLYREFVRTHHTYEAFNRELLRMLQARGIHD